MPTAKSTTADETRPKPEGRYTKDGGAGRAATPIRVCISDHLSEDGITILKNEPGLAVDVKTGLSSKELAEIIGPYEGLVVRSSTKVTAEEIANAGGLKVIGRAGGGV